MDDHLPTLFSNLGLGGLELLQVLTSLFMAILFLQSGLDKVFNYKGNKDYFQDHFKNSPLASFVSLMTPAITLIETAAGLACGIGAVVILAGGSTAVAFWGMLLSSLSLVMLFFGQRLAQDYAGASVLVPYFLLSLAGLYFLLI